MNVRGHVSLRASLKLLLVFSSVVAGCTEAQIEALLFPGEGEVLGRVVDAAGVGVAGIKVTTTGGGLASATTDANGVFTIRPVGAGSSVDVSLDLFSTEYWSPAGENPTQSVQVLGGETTRVPPFTIRRYATVRGVVRLAVAGGTPIPGVTLRCNQTLDEALAESCNPSSLDSGPDGSFAMKLKAGSHGLTPVISNMGLVSGRPFEGFTVADGEMKTVDLILDGVGAVEVRVEREDGFFVDDVPVTIAGHGSQETSIGGATFNRVLRGRREISIVVPPGFVMAPNQTARRTIDVQMGQELEVVFVLREAIGGIVGRVTTVAGAGVGDVLIRHSSGLERRTLASGSYGMVVESEGSHTLTIIPPAGYEVVPPGTPVRTTTVSFGVNSTVDWQIRPIASGTGTIVVHVREDGRPMAGIAITVEGQNLSGVTAANGDLVFSNVPAGTHNVRLTLPEDWDTENGDPTVKTISLTGGSTLEITWILCPIDDGYEPPGDGATAGPGAPKGPSRRAVAPAPVTPRAPRPLPR